MIIESIRNTMMGKDCKMKKFIVLISAIFALGGCGTSPLATCAPGDTACLEAAIAATGEGLTTESSVPGENYRDHPEGDPPDGAPRPCDGYKPAPNSG